MPRVILSCCEEALIFGAFGREKFFGKLSIIAVATMEKDDGMSMAAYRELDMRLWKIHRSKFYFPSLEYGTVGKFDHRELTAPRHWLGSRYRRRWMGFVVSYLLILERFITRAYIRFHRERRIEPLKRHTCFRIYNRTRIKISVFLMSHWVVSGAVYGQN